MVLIALIFLNFIIILCLKKKYFLRFAESEFAVEKN